MKERFKHIIDRDNNIISPIQQKSKVILKGAAMWQR